MKPNICIFSQSLGIGGAEKQAIMLAKALKTHANVYILVYYDNIINTNFLRIVKDSNLNTIILTGNTISKIIKIFRTFNKYKIDVLFNYLLLPNIVGGIISKCTGVKYSIGGIRTSHIEKYKVLFNKVVFNFLNNFTIYNNYAGFKKYSELGFKKAKGVVIQNCIEINECSIEKKESKKIVILSVGRFHLAKDYITALKAIKILFEKNNNLFYQIVGYGTEENKIKEFITQNSMDHYVKIYDPPNRIEDFYERADIYLQTSIFEGLSNTVMEAMASSLPLVVTDVGDNSTLFEVNKGGFLCLPKDVSGIVNSLEKLILKNDLRISMGKNNYKIISENYSIEEFAKKYINFIKQLGIDI